MTEVPPIDGKEFAARRARLLKELGGAVALVAAGEHAGHGEFLADANFRYLTGLDGENGGVLLFDGSNDDVKRRVVLFLKPGNPEAEQWTGLRPAINGELKKRLGIDTVLRTGSLPAVLTAALRRTKQAACVMPFATYPAPVSTDLNAFQQVAQRVPGVKIEDRTGPADLDAGRAFAGRAEVDRTGRPDHGDRVPTGHPAHPTGPE